MLRKKLVAYIQILWCKTTSHQRLTAPEKIVFLILCIFEKIYQSAFFVVNKLKQRRKHFFFAQTKVISVGNLSVGGTGKSVIVPFLIKALLCKKGAIFLRGYRSTLESSGKSVMVSDGNTMLCDVAMSGDEAYMLARLAQVPVVVGKKRVESAQILADYCAKTKCAIDYVVLDDAYQNHQLKKDFEILLVDARRPLENGHCLPAGRLREKDYSRANAIILTHADAVVSDDIQKIKTHLFAHFDATHIFEGRHAIVSVLLHNSGDDQMLILKNKKTLLFAGIGSFSNVCTSAQKLGVEISAMHEYEDHHDYSVADLEMIASVVKKNNLDGALTTAKDWYKIEPLVRLHDQFKNMRIYVLNIEFEFLSAQGYSSFMKLMKRRLEK